MFEDRLLLNPVWATPPMVGAEEQLVHTDVELAHVVLEKEPAGQVPEHAAVISPMVVP